MRDYPKELGHWELITSEFLRSREECGGAEP